MHEQRELANRRPSQRIYTPAPVVFHIQVDHEALNFWLVPGQALIGLGFGVFDFYVVSF